ncbi:hypothetical protein G7046_g3173 [Stylonectria norvegica]|nr:hypothetical protein G7046_g3173 [Stylonectria norvegica]
MGNYGCLSRLLDAAPGGANDNDNDDDMKNNEPGNPPLMDPNPDKEDIPQEQSLQSKVSTAEVPQPDEQHSSNGSEANLDTPATSTEVPIQNTLNLHPLEQSAPRRYIRVSMILPWARKDYMLLMQCKEEFFRPLANDPTKLELVWPIPSREFPCLIETWPPQDPPTAPPLNMFEFEISNLDKSRFRWEREIAEGQSFAPVGLKVCFLEGCVSLGFCFSEIIFDTGFIGNFFHEFSRNSMSISSQPISQGLALFSDRLSVCRLNRKLVNTRPRPKDTKKDVKLEDFEFYNTSNAPILPPRPRNELKCCNFSIKANQIREIHDCVMMVTPVDDPARLSLNEDCVLALFWINIMRARWQNKRFIENEAARLNVNVCGVRQINKPPLENCYFGNTSVTTVATCSGTSLLGLGNDPGQGVALTEMVEAPVYANAVSTFREALGDVTKDYVRCLGTLKTQVSRAEEHDAYERAMQRGSQSLSFEDWSSWGDDCAVEIPYATGKRPYFFPCVDDMEEGRMILLPRMGRGLGTEMWTMCVCLENSDMKQLMRQLMSEVWWFEGRVLDKGDDMGRDLRKAETAVEFLQRFLV